MEIVRFLLTKNTNENFINSGNPSPIWHAVNQGHHDVVKALIRNGHCDLTSEAPDGTTIDLLAFLYDDKEMINILKDASLDGIEENQDEKQEFKSTLLLSSDIFPKFNDDIEEPFSSGVVRKEKIITYDELEQQRQQGFCPISKLNYKDPRLKDFYYFGDTCNGHCER